MNTKKITYKLTPWQWFVLCMKFPIWIFLNRSKRKTWHQMKKGMEKHVHKFTIPQYIHGTAIGWRCEHDGCFECNLVKSKKHAHSRAYIREINRKLKQCNIKQIQSK